MSARIRRVLFKQRALATMVLRAALISYVCLVGCDTEYDSRNRVDGGSDADTYVDADANNVCNLSSAHTSLLEQDTTILATPGYLETIEDPFYGGRVTLVTGAADTPMLNIPARNWPTRTRHGYSSHQVWNADSSLIYLARGQVFLDGHDYLPVSLPSVPSGFWQWSPTEPDIMIVPCANGVGKWNVRTGEWVDTVPIPGYHGFGFQTRTSPSNDGARIGVKAWRDSDNMPFWGLGTLCLKRNNSI